MFRVRGISHEEKLENLRSVLDQEDKYQEKRGKVGHLPSNREILGKICSLESIQDTSEANELSVFVNTLVADVWLMNGQKKKMVCGVCDWC